MDLKVEKSKNVTGLRVGRRTKIINPKNVTAGLELIFLLFFTMFLIQGVKHSKIDCLKNAIDA